MSFIFQYNDGSDPCVTETNEELFDMLLNYRTTRTDTDTFVVEGRRDIDSAGITEDDKRDLLRDIAIQWQSDFDMFDHSCGELLEWQDFF